MFKEMGQAGLVIRIIPAAYLYINGDLHAMQVRHLHGHNAQTVMEGLFATIDHHLSENGFYEF
jgi:hypothetical protein